MELIPFAVLILGGLGLGRIGLPAWWPAILAAVVTPPALVWFATSRAAHGLDYPATGSAAFDIVGSIALFLIAVYYSYGVGFLWRRRAIGEQPTVRPGS